MISDVMSELRTQSYERLKSPILGSFSISWLVVNWKLVTVLFFSEKKVEERITFIQDNYFQWESLLLYPLLFSILYTLMLPWINLCIQFFQQNADSRRRVLKIKAETIYLTSSFDRAKAQAELNRILARDEATRNQQEELEELRQQLQEKEQNAEARLETVEKAYQDQIDVLNNKIQQSGNDDNSEDQREIERLKQQLEDEKRRVQAEADKIRREFETKQQKYSDSLYDTDDKHSFYSSTLKAFKAFFDKDRPYITKDLRYIALDEQTDNRICWHENHMFMIHAPTLDPDISRYASNKPETYRLGQKAYLHANVEDFSNSNVEYKVQVNEEVIFDLASTVKVQSVNEVSFVSNTEGVDLYYDADRSELSIMIDIELTLYNPFTKVNITEISYPNDDFYIVRSSTPVQTSSISITLPYNYCFDSILFSHPENWLREHQATNVLAYSTDQWVMPGIQFFFRWEKDKENKRD